MTGPGTWLGRLRARFAQRPGDDGIERHLAIGGASILLLVLGGGGWATMAALNGAVVTSGTIVVESSGKRIQHPEGGVVGVIAVKEGQHVTTGETLLRLDDTVTLANLMVVDTQLVELSARRSRLEAERDRADEVRHAPDLVSRRGEANVARALDGEISLFASRRTAMEGQVSQLRTRVEQLGEEVKGLDAQIAAKSVEIGFIKEEIAGADELYRKGLTPLTRLRTLQRDEARIAGERGQLEADLARTRGRISETELQILQLDQDRRAEVIEQLREIEGKWAELQERRIAAQDKLTRVELRAPVAGIVHQLDVHTVGGVVSPGQTVMMIVPGNDALVIEARISPADIDQVSIGQTAEIRLAAFNQKTTPELKGFVSRIAADLTTDERAGLSYYVAQITLPPDQIAQLGELKLIPGMPAEVFLQTGERSALSYFVKPLQDQIARAMREE
ncbi:HlyD family type I secretion periplasmic adaptor subunit [Ancylobacter defluvii]|uniref:Membrane fusion protein (MFP) family protein n=1 Tax=Ancylobacter defluvii TaxID=1282440 RepID=A0A9W6JZP6_9HYPH|nr:HlyD family type I secretion periplasmic adaptor subunit [Ancylobacter defluvii]MBS7586812.1 HlyD family type I secretion periplasmic adaptor subunit [Ancylobacter defluvii]GLK86117.1 HlyD family type I secretion periplasmic adaptor subunit [Ancylobacter defluvii]